MNDNSIKLVKNILDKNFTDAKEILTKQLFQKAGEQIAARKEEVAQTLYKEEKNISLDEESAKVGDWVKIIIDDPKWDGRIGTISEINPVAGYKGYSIHLFDDDTSLTVNSDEVVVLKGKRLKYYQNKYE